MKQKYIIQTVDLENSEVLMVKTPEQMKEWIKKYNVTDKNGKKADLRKATDGYVVRVNGKMLRVSRW